MIMQLGVHWIGIWIGWSEEKSSVDIAEICGILGSFSSVYI
jgi:hypothetical protein